MKKIMEYIILFIFALYSLATVISAVHFQKIHYMILSMIMATIIVLPLGLFRGFITPLPGNIFSAIALGILVGTALSFSFVRSGELMLGLTWGLSGGFVLGFLLELIPIKVYSYRKAKHNN